MADLVGKRILGIDPGTIVMGYGLIEIKKDKPEILHMGVVKTKGFNDHYLRLKQIFIRTKALIEEYLPDEVAIESPFYGKDVKVILKLGRVQGIVMGLALSMDIPVAEYAPLKVKQSITGMGRASKEQVAYFLMNTMKIKKLPPELDATDALAVAVCHYLHMKNPISKGKYSGWSDFIKKNPSRIK